MSVSDGYGAFLAEALAGLGPIRIRRMFGGGGVFLGDVMFALIANDTLYLKADDTTRVAFEAEGMEAFIYERKGKPAAMSYWQVPDRLLDDPDELVTWAGEALAVATANKRAKR